MFEDQGPSLSGIEHSRDGDDTMCVMVVTERGRKIGSLRIRTASNLFYKPIKEKDLRCGIRMRDEA